MTDWASDYPTTDQAAHPARLKGRASVRATLLAAASPGRVLVALALSGLMAYALQKPAPPPTAEQILAAMGTRPEVPASEAPAWITVVRPAAMFSLDAPGFPRDSHAVEARRHSSGGGREEVHLFGSAEGAGQARVILYRPGSEGGSPATFFLELARRAAEAGYAVERSAVPVQTATKFGLAETAEVIFQGGTRPQSCLAFRLLAEEAGLRISGWACSGDGRPMDRAAFACFIDRLELASAGDDKSLKAYFATADRNRLTQCRMSARRAAAL